MHVSLRCEDWGIVLSPIKTCASLTSRCLVIVLAFVVLVLAAVLGINAEVDRQLSIAFPSLETVLQHDDALMDDRFDLLASRDLANCEIVIFDDKGTRLYASSRAIADDISFATVEAMGESDVIEMTDFAGMLDSMVQRYDYETGEGASRTLIVASPVANEASFERVTDSIGRLWLMIIPLVGVLALCCQLLLARMIRNAVRPLDAAFEAYRNEGKVPNQTAIVPTELRPSLEGFASLARQLDTARLEKQRLIADASHDLKTPLTVIKGYAQALDDGIVPPERQSAYLKAIVSRSTKAADLIDALFSFAKMDHPDFSAACVRKDVGELVKTIADDKRLDVEQAGCILDYRIGAGSLFASVDTDLMMRLASNLIDNACKHNPLGTRIEIGCERVGEGVTLYVADDGVGIPDSLKEGAFEPFVTNDEARSTGAGTGLGLSIARRCAEVCGGTIAFAEHPRVPFTTEVVVVFPALDND